MNNNNPGDFVSSCVNFFDLATYFSVAMQAKLAEEIHHDYLVHLRKTAEQHYRPIPKERDHDNYVSLLNGTGEPI